MKVSDSFKKLIQDYLNGRAEQDPLFAETLKKPAKNIDDCINYILSEVQKSGCNGFADEEIYGMAIHYYDEDDIKPGKAKGARVVVNHSSKNTVSKEEKKAVKAGAEAKPKDSVKKAVKIKENPLQSTISFD